MRKIHRSARRSGVILMVVLALLTLFTIVGLTFVFCSEKVAAASQNWREASWFTFGATRRDLMEALAGDRDFSGSHKAIDAVRTSGGILLAEIREALQAEQDPNERDCLERSRKAVEEQARALTVLEWLIQQIELSPKEQRT